MFCKKSIFVFITLTSLLSGCREANHHELTASGLDPERFQTTVDGKETGLYTMRNDSGMEVCITNFGGRIVSIWVPGRNDKFSDVVLGFDSIEAYFPENNQTDFGASIGRYANRINQGRMVINGETIQLPQNNFGHCLHGGPSGWQYKVYDVVEANDSIVRLRIVSPDGDNNFPGEVSAQVCYSLTADNRLEISYEATTSAPTVINMTNHSYFNLSGNPSGNVLDQLLTVYADSITPVDSTFMTTGEIVVVEGTPMDFRVSKALGKDIEMFDFEQIKFANGYDHNYVLNARGDISKPAAVLSDPSTGIVMTVYTTEPGLQVYSGNFLDGTVTGKSGIKYEKQAGICLETQHYPDSPNKPWWPSVMLLPGEKYTSKTIYSFTTK